MRFVYWNTLLIAKRNMGVWDKIPKPLLRFAPIDRFYQETT